MKKAFLFFVMLAVTLSLSSCTVNWFGSTLEVDWYFVVTPVVVIFIVAYMILMSKTYICPQCKTKFKAKPYQLYTTIHWGGKRIAKCPKCGRKGLCKTQSTWNE